MNRMLVVGLTLAGLACGSPRPDAARPEKPAEPAVPTPGGLALRDFDSTFDVLSKGEYETTPAYWSRIATRRDTGQLLFRISPREFGELSYDADRGELSAMVTTVFDTQLRDMMGIAVASETASAGHVATRSVIGTETSCGDDYMVVARAHVTPDSAPGLKAAVGLYVAGRLPKSAKSAFAEGHTNFKAHYFDYRIALSDAELWLVDERSGTVRAKQSLCPTR